MTADNIQSSRPDDTSGPALHTASIFPLQRVTLRGPIPSRDSLHRGARGFGEIKHRDTWDQILCEGVPISLRELVLLVLDAITLPVNMENAQEMLKCRWRLNWHVHTKDHNGLARHYRGGGVTSSTTSNYLRGDWIETAVTDTDRRTRVQTSRLCRMICGIEITHVKKLLDLDFPEQLWETEDNKRKDKLCFILVRYMSPHRSGRRRGPKHRPLCPGVLQDTHCLWSWAKRPATFQRGCLRGRNWERNKRFFGDNDVTQQLRKDAEKKAWYDVIQAHDIEGHANVQLDPDRDQSFLQSTLWC
jgi:hypothetical protein